MVQGNMCQEFRLKIIEKIRNYFVRSIAKWTDKKEAQKSLTLNYIEHLYFKFCFCFLVFL